MTSYFKPQLNRSSLVQHLPIPNKVGPVRYLNIQQLRPVIEILRVPIHLGSRHFLRFLIHVVDQRSPRTYSTKNVNLRIANTHEARKPESTWIRPKLTFVPRL